MSMALTTGGPSTLRPTFRLNYSGRDVLLPPHVTALRIHEPDDAPLPAHVVAGTATFGNPQGEVWCRITMDGPLHAWAVNVPPRAVQALWGPRHEATAPPLGAPHAVASTSEIAPRDYWGTTAAPGDWLLRIGRQTFGITLPDLPPLPPIWCEDSQPIPARWRLLRVLHDRATPRPERPEPRLDPRQRAIARWVYDAVLRDLLARHTKLRHDEHEHYAAHSGYTYLLLYNPVAAPSLRHEFLRYTLHVLKPHDTETRIDLEAACPVRRPRVARDEYPQHQLATLQFDLATARFHTAEAGQRWWSHAPQYARFDFLHELTLPELEQLVLAGDD